MMAQRAFVRRATIATAILLSIGLAGCGREEKPTATITLATTTSVYQSGLLDALVARFRAESGIEVKVVAVGTGQALELARRGDADIVVSHAPAAEAQFLADGHAVRRREIIKNDFILVGPSSDPAGIGNRLSITDAFQQLAEAKEPFVSRSDESGTHKREHEIWSRARIAPAGDWYRRAGTGMSQALRMADEIGGYTLTDRGTYVSQRDKLRLTVVSEGDPMLLNTYSVLELPPDRIGAARAEAAGKLAAFLAADATRAFIAEFGVREYGEPLFHPIGEAAKTK